MLGGIACGIDGGVRRSWPLGSRLKHHGDTPGSLDTILDVEKSKKEIDGKLM